MADRPITFSRRRFLSATAGVGFSVTIAANGHKVVAQQSTPVSTPGLTVFSEAPQFAEQAAAGALPPLAERLPIDPLVVTPNDSIGTYGGNWRTALVGGSDTTWLGRTIGYDYLIRWDIEWEESIPNIASAFESNVDGTEYTFTLRQGMKWSDGAPFTVDDILFYVDDVYGHPELGGGGGANPYTATKVDDLTFTVTFERPNGLFLAQLSASTGEPWTQYPKHYLSQFHETYNATNLDQLVAEAGVADWLELFRTKGGSIPGTPYNAVWANLELPRLHAWSMTTPYGDGERVTFERNPYYWKVDPDGNQLPYIDMVTFNVVQDNEVLLLKAAAGELDMHTRHINTPQNKPVLADARESGGFHFIDMALAIMNTGCYQLNLTHKNLVKREIFANKDFRIGLSHAINRQEIINTVYVGQGEPWQTAPRPETPFYNETLAKQYTEFDLTRANEFLDKVLPEKDGDGWRLQPDGQRLTFVLEVATGGQFAELVDVSNLVVSYWREVGLDVQLLPEDRSLMFSRTEANDHDVAVWPGSGGLLDALANAFMYLPQTPSSLFGVGWAAWWANSSNSSAEPVEPPEPIKQQFALYEEMSATADTEEQYRLFGEILAIAQEQFLSIGISLPAPGYGIVSDTMRNVPATMPDAYIYMTPGPTNPQQYYFE